METQVNVKDDSNDHHGDYLGKDKTNEAAVCFMTAKDVELTVDEVVECNMTSLPPALPKSGKVYMFVSNDSMKAGTMITT